jgi:menaquinone reductase, multiheme cytochrome c subunit
MSAIFPKSSDKILRIGGAIVLFMAVAGGSVVGYLALPEVVDTGYSPVQPVAYSHKLHAGNLGMDCFYCHSTVERSWYAAVPATETCMNCHVRVRKDGPRLAKVRESHATGKPIPWVEIHKLPDYVYFNHQAHVQSGVSCVSCHGRVDQMIEVKQVQPLTMAWCLDCHRNPAPNVRPVELVTNLAWDPGPEKREQIGKELVAEKRIVPPTNCSGCHR